MNVEIKEQLEKETKKEKDKKNVGLGEKLEEEVTAQDMENEDNDPFARRGAVSRSPVRGRTYSLPNMNGNEKISISTGADVSSDKMESQVKDGEGSCAFIPRQVLASMPSSEQGALAQSRPQEEEDTNTESEGLTQRAKRKRQDKTLNTGSKAKSEEILAKKALDQILRNIALLTKLVAESYKPKKELTDISGRLSYYAKQLTSEGQGNWLEDLIDRLRSVRDLRLSGFDI